MELIIYIAPMINKNIVVYNELNLEIINHSDLLVDDAYFYDPAHVNIKGRELATKALADELK